MGWFAADTDPLFPFSHPKALPGPSRMWWAGKRAWQAGLPPAAPGLGALCLLSGRAFTHSPGIHPFTGIHGRQAWPGSLVPPSPNSDFSHPQRHASTCVPPLFYFCPRLCLPPSLSVSEINEAYINGSFPPGHSSIPNTENRQLETSQRPPCPAAGTTEASESSPRSLSRCEGVRSASHCH